ncbi:hypothetical protein M0812_21289 [Anaeramoeba flamelloides]|uniref:Uncharacterized protein n=1 Tax=Anaeramoeba flamelloides TaxID=1746091 RepID=A0AAV7YYA9_9EUKA|nr:hypothetical protein M0812_21289 [Anaeramoeba flamelloides]
MKIKVLLIFLLFVSSILCCASDKKCTSKDEPRCVDEKCVECREHSDCDLNKYCSEKNECIKYSDDGKFGEFCHTDDCSLIDTQEVCGECNDDGTAIWRGACISYKCYSCWVDRDPTDTSFIINQHSNYAMCVPKGAWGAAGKIVSYQSGNGAPGFVIQDASAIAIISFGIIIFFLLIVQCITFFKMTV